MILFINRKLEDEKKEGRLGIRMLYWNKYFASKAFFENSQIKCSCRYEEILFKKTKPFFAFDDSSLLFNITTTSPDFIKIGLKKVLLIAHFLYSFFTYFCLFTFKWPGLQISIPYFRVGVNFTYKQKCMHSSWTL